jgi:hypothetical protein
VRQQRQHHGARRAKDKTEEILREHEEIERRREKTVEQQLRGLARSRGWRITRKGK